MYHHELSSLRPSTLAVVPFTGEITTLQSTPDPLRQFASLSKVTSPSGCCNVAVTRGMMSGVSVPGVAMTIAADSVDPFVGDDASDHAGYQNDGSKKNRNLAFHSCSSIPLSDYLQAGTLKGVRIETPSVPIASIS
jgi:hypothetical protein